MGGGGRVERGGGLVSEIFLQRIQILKKVRKLFFCLVGVWRGGGGGGRGLE